MINKTLGLYKKHKEIVHYLIVGVLTTIVSIASYNFFRIWIPDDKVYHIVVGIEGYIICTVFSWIIAVLFAYITNRIFVFESKEKRIVKEMSSFFGARLLTLGIEIFVMFLLVKVLYVNDRIAKILVQFIIVVLNYVFSKLLVFNKKKDNKNMTKKDI